MAKIVLTVDPRTGVTYFPKVIRREGFTGKIEGFPNVFTVTFFRPGTKLSDIEKSLHIILRDIKLRKTKEETENQTEKDKG